MPKAGGTAIGRSTGAGAGLSAGAAKGFGGARTNAGTTVGAARIQPVPTAFGTSPGPQRSGPAWFVDGCRTGTQAPATRRVPFGHAALPVPVGTANRPVPFGRVGKVPGTLSGTTGAARDGPGGVPGRTGTT
jgi:hypothetical protein